MSIIHYDKDEGGHDFVKIEWTGDVAKRSTVIRHIQKLIVRALTALNYPKSEVESWQCFVPDYDPYDKDGATEVRDVTMYDGETKRNGWMVWDETRDCFDGCHFRYVYFGFSIY